MRYIALLIAANVMLGQTPKEKWAGSWALDTQKSTFGAALPPGVTIVSQTLKLEQTATAVHISGDTVLSQGGGPMHEDNTLPLDGKEIVRGPISLSFRRIDDFTFDITSTGTNGGRAFVEVSRYVVSPDGQSITATKARTSVSKAVLVYTRRVQ